MEIVGGRLTTLSLGGEVNWRARRALRRQGVSVVVLRMVPAAEGPIRQQRTAETGQTR